MATKTVINSKAAALPQTCGISIIIDQAQQQQQQQHLDSISSATSRIAISPNISTATTVAQSNCNTSSSSNKRETNLNNNNNNNNNSYKTRYSTTFVNINRNEDDDQNTRTGLTRPKQHIVEKESMIITTMSTFPQQRQQQQLSVDKATTARQDQVDNGSSNSPITGTPVSERRKTKVNVEEEVKKAEATTYGLGKVVESSSSSSSPSSAVDNNDQRVSVSHVSHDGGMGTDVGKCVAHEHYNENNTDSTKLVQMKTNHDNDVLTTSTETIETTTTTTVIACNHVGEQKNFNTTNDHQKCHDHQDSSDHNDANDNDVVESCLSGSSGEYFNNISVGSSLPVDGNGIAAPKSPFWPQLENNVAAHSSSKSLEIEIDPDCASALTETLANADQPNSLVVKIKISTNEHNGEDDKVLSYNTNTTKESNSSVSENRIQKGKNPRNNTSHTKLNSNSANNENENDNNNKPKVTVVQVNELQRVYKTPTPELKLKIHDDKMVQKPCATQNGQTNANSNGNTTVTELNVPNQSSATSSSSYLYYMMSSGQFSPCDTLDSGTGSDLENNVVSNSPPPKMQTNSSSAPKLELHLKTTKIRVNTGAPNNSAKEKAHKVIKNAVATEHLRAGSLTDSEESESSLSCDSLNSSEFLRHNSNSPTTIVQQSRSSAAITPATPSKSNGTFLPDSLLRDIRDRKFPTNDFVSKYVDNNHPTIYECVVEPTTTMITTTHNSNSNSSPIHSPTTVSFTVVQDAVAHAKYVRERNNSNLFSKRASLPSKTFVLNTQDGSFVDTKMNSMPRKYEADKYYNFHVNEHENFRSFGNGSIGNGTDLSDNGDGCSDAGSWTDYETKSMVNDDAFAGYKDIRCNSAASTIRSSKGTVRGVKNRVRNGIATFLQLQQPNVKNYKEKDLGKVVLYTTSMGIIRDTYAKCSNVKQILRTLLVKFEERDVFMSVEYQQEIKERMHSEAIKVPQLFVEGQHIGDAETVERLNESGELRQLLKPYKSIATTYTCQTCGGYRLLPCPSCNGSKKSVHRNHFTAEFVALKCMNCDEVGLVKCHNC